MTTKDWNKMVTIENGEGGKLEIHLNNGEVFTVETPEHFIDDDCFVAFVIDYENDGKAYYIDIRNVIYLVSL